MSYDVDDPIPFEEGSQEYFREIDRRIFHPRYMRLTAGPSGKLFSLFVDFEALAGKDVLEAGGEALPFEDASFDVVFSWGVIHHSSDMDRALRELVRVCRPGGDLVLMVYHRRSFFYAAYKGFQRFLPLARRLGLHFEGARAGETEGLIARHFTVDELRRKLEDAGLADVRITPYGQDAELLPLPRRIRLPITERLPQRLKDTLLRRYGHQLAVTATKP